MKSPLHLRRTCPACGASADGSERTISSAPAAEGRSVDDLQPYWNGFFRQKIFFTYTRCAGCGLLFCPVFFQPQELARLYSEMPDNTAGVPLSALNDTQRAYYELVRSRNPQRGGYLELGPDIGLLTERAIEHDIYDEYWLFEPNRKVWPALKHKLGAKKGHLLSEMMDLSAVPDGSITVAAAVHVLDHLLDPSHMLQQLRRKLRAGGILLLVTHNESSVLARVAGARWPAYCLQHPQLYNPESIAYLLRACGYTAIATERSVNHFPLMYLVKHGLWVMGIKAANLPFQDRWSMPLKLGNIATLATVE